jgi:hypothetical protein
LLKHGYFCDNDVEIVGGVGFPKEEGMGFPIEGLGGGK